jgi:hypothetical protein
VELAIDVVEGLLCSVRKGLPVDVTISNMLEERAAIERQPAKWQVIVKDLAEEFSYPVSEVEQILSAETHQLEQGAHIKVFVPLLAIKEVKTLLRLSRRTPPRHEPRDPNPPQPSHH